ncbi:MAG TPA: HslU--HslV peptidase proteolytic subunit [Bacteroidetes bacterium]|nr:MAG: HslU--HslV peptidase proteolytic subunit [Ignavibacteria bacterium GWA2_54_16]HCA80323.1 HslU--HslV peptidase proteolytic subunit [Bacteroidota bacterium]
METFHATTILGVRRDGRLAIGGDGQVTLGNTVMKQQANKIRKLHQGKVLVGFAGAAADAFSLLDRFEEKLEQHQGQLVRAAVELAKLWRTDKYLRQLEALLAAMDATHSLVISGTGEVIEPDDGIVAIGSGGPYALAAARMLVKHTQLPAKDIVRESLQAAGQICIYTNTNIIVEEL